MFYQKDCEKIEDQHLQTTGKKSNLEFYIQQKYSLKVKKKNKNFSDKLKECHTLNPERIHPQQTHPTIVVYKKSFT